MDLNEYHRFCRLSLSERVAEASINNPYVSMLQDKLLLLGGKQLCVHPGDKGKDCQGIYERGKVVTLPVSLREMEQSNCHGNVSKLFLQGKLKAIVTGYCLTTNSFTDNSLWCQHSFGLTARRIVETTCVRDLYHGVVMTGAEAIRFAISNISFEEVKKCIDKGTLTMKDLMSAIGQGESVEVEDNELACF